MPHITQASGDSRLDRRYDFARAALNRGDAAGAADVLEQTLALMPGWAAAWQLLGYAREDVARGRTSRGQSLPAQPDFTRAIAAHVQARLHDADGRLGAALDLARLGALAMDAVDPAIYVAALFEDYAPRFDKHLRFGLAYRGPEVLLEAVLRVVGLRELGLPFARGFDLGCGTGLAGEVFQPHCSAMAGVDLSPNMVARARAKTAHGKAVYARLAAGDGAAALADEAAGSLDLVLAADVFVYVGELGPVLAAVARALAPEGLLAFTVQSMPDAAVGAGGTMIGDDKRFAHSRAYLDTALGAAGLVPLLVEPTSARKEDLKPVPGLAIVAGLA